MQALLDTMRKLRGPDGCPWDRQQSHESLRPYLLEEAAEAVDAIATGDAAQMAEELGDVLLQVAFHAIIAEETGSFSYERVEASIVDKLVRRHPHVFGDVNVADAEEVVRNWQSIKAKEKDQPSPAESVPRSLPALMRAAALGKKLGWRVPDAAELQRLLRDFCEQPSAEGLGRILLSLTLFATQQGLAPELALRDAAEARAARTVSEPPQAELR